MKFKHQIKLALLGLGGVLLSNGLVAQHNFEFNNQGAEVTIQAGASVTVWGDVINEGATALLDNNGNIEVQGNMFSDAFFQQRGTGTTLIINDDVNVTDRQFIEGSYAVRGGQAATGVNDGSFYNLELANSQGVVHLVGGGNVADVRNSVNFQPGALAVNRIITHDTNSVPINGSSYSATFGMMNPTASMASFLNATTVTNSRMSGVDNGYVQGCVRRAILPAGGLYEFIPGLEPAGAAAARGMQCIELDFGVNNYDVIVAFFQEGSTNIIPGSPTQCGYSINYFAGADHGEWMFRDQTGIGTGDYEVIIWPQDGTWPAQSVWFVTKDDAILGTAGMCGPLTTGLNRTAFSGLGAAQFSFAGSTIILDENDIMISATPKNNRYIQIDWTNTEEWNLDNYELERSLDELNFVPVSSAQPVGNDQTSQSYGYPDHDVIPDQDYFYRVRFEDQDGNTGLTQTVQARLSSSGLASEINVFPVPVGSEGLTIQFSSPKDKAYTFRVYDAIGKLVHDQTIEVGAGVSERIVNTQNWSAGTYFLHLRSENESLVKEIIRKR